MVGKKVGRLWAFRAEAELEAAARFAKIGRELDALAAPQMVVDLAGEAVADERRHHERCAELALRFGCDDFGCIERPAASPTNGVTPNPRSLLLEVIAMSCVTESLSTALLIEMRTRAEDRNVRRVVSEILRDEVQHARLGWAHLAAQSGAIDVAFVGPHLPAMLAATVQEEMFEGGRGPGDDLGPFGGLPRSVRRETFVATMQGVVFPGLRRFGIDTLEAERWIRRRDSPQRTFAQE